MKFCANIHKAYDLRKYFSKILHISICFVRLRHNYFVCHRIIVHFRFLAILHSDNDYLR